MKVFWPLLLLVSWVSASGEPAAPARLMSVEGMVMVDAKPISNKGDRLSCPALELRSGQEVRCEIDGSALVLFTSGKVAAVKAPMSLPIVSDSMVAGSVNRSGRSKPDEEKLVRDLNDWFRRLGGDMAGTRGEEKLKLLYPVLNEGVPPWSEIPLMITPQKTPVTVIITSADAPGRTWEGTIRPGHWTFLADTPWAFARKLYDEGIRFFTIALKVPDQAPLSYSIGFLHKEDLDKLTALPPRSEARSLATAYTRAARVQALGYPELARYELLSLIKPAPVK